MDQFPRSGAFDPWVNVIFQALGRRPGAYRIAKGVHTTKAFLFQKPNRILKFLFSLTGKADDHIRRKSYLRDLLANVMDAVTILGHGIPPAHAFQYRII